MNKESRFRISFRIFHPTISAADIESNFKFPTRYSRSVGKLRATKSGELLGGTYKSTSVCFVLYEDSLTFDNFSLNDILNEQLATYNKAYTSYVSASGGDCNFLIGIFSENNVMFNLELETIQMLAASKISVTYDFYGYED